MSDSDNSSPEMGWLLRHTCGETVLSYSLDIYSGISIAVYRQTAHWTQMPPVRQLLLGAAF